MSKHFTPRLWQSAMIDHIVEHRRCALWSPVGSGKTVVILTATEALDMTHGDVYPMLVLGPLRVARKVWREEIAKWHHTKHLTISQLIGDAPERTAALNRKAHIYTMNYENLDWLERQLRGVRLPFRTIVADEARRLKGYRTKQGAAQARALAEFAWHPDIKHFIELGATPATNGLKDLWGQVHFLDQGVRLGRTYSAFEERWFAYKRVKDAVHAHKTHMQTIIQPNADDEIHKLVGDLCLSIDLSQYVKIDEPVFVPIKVELPPDARKRYREMEDEFFTRIEGHEIEAFNAGVKSGKLLQLANGAAYADPELTDDDDPKARKWLPVHDAKIEALQSIIEEVGGMPILVAYNFKSDAARLLKAIPGSRVLHSEQDEDDFKAGNIPVLLVHPKSAGHGIDGFQFVTNVLVNYGCNWDLELRLQTIGRIGPERQMQAGFNRPTFVYDLIAEDTIDEVVLERHASKRGVMDLLLEAVKARR